MFHPCSWLITEFSGSCPDLAAPRRADPALQPPAPGAPSPPPYLPSAGPLFRASVARPLLFLTWLCCRAGTLSCPPPRRRTNLCVHIIRLGVLPSSRQRRFRSHLHDVGAVKRFSAVHRAPNAAEGGNGATRVQTPTLPATRSVLGKELPTF